MMWGINWGCPPIPPEVSRWFRKQIAVAPRKMAMLDGVCTLRYELAAMILQASNGKRRFFIKTRMWREGRMYIAIYTHTWKDVPSNTREFFKTDKDMMDCAAIMAKQDKVQ